MIFTYDDFDLSGIRTYPLKSRAAKTRVDDFARPFPAGGSIDAFVESLPSLLAAADFRAIVAAIVDAKRNDGGIVWVGSAAVTNTAPQQRWPVVAVSGPLVLPSW